MQKIKNIFSKVWGYLKARGAAFYLLIPVVIFSFIIPFVYKAGFGDTYFLTVAFVLPFLAIPLFGAVFFKPMAKYAAVAIYIIEFVSLLVFVNTTYMHLTTVFFNGIEGNVIEQMGFHFSFCVIVFLINIGLSVAAVFLKQFKTKKATEENIHEQEVQA